MTLATLLSDTGRTEEGHQYMQRAVGVAPLDPVVRSNMAAFLLRQGKIDEAISAYHHILSIDPHLPIAMSNLARAYRARGDVANAEHWFLESLSLKEDVATYNSLGALYFNTGRHQEAKLRFSGALLLNPTHLEARCSYCQSLLQLNQREDVEAEALSALQHHSSAPCLHLVLAKVYAQKNMLQEAYNHATLALEATDAKSRAEAYHIQAGILKDMDQLVQAEESYRQAIALSPTMLNAHMNLGALLHIRKKYAEARTYYERALELDPGNQMVRDNLVKLDRLERQGNVS
jgi:Flp pilus assembly protein TadD